MDHFKYVSWLSFSEKYRQSPFLRLDNTVVNEDGIANKPIDNSMLENNIEESQVKKTEYTELRKHIFMKKSKASTCGELLNQIRNLLFIMYNNDKLGYLYDELVTLIETLKYQASKDQNLIL